jgi:PAS domain S-box-containing protein
MWSAIYHIVASRSGALLHRSVEAAEPLELPGRLPAISPQSNRLSVPGITGGLCGALAIVLGVVVLGWSIHPALLLERSTGIAFVSIGLALVGIVVRRPLLILAGSGVASILATGALIALVWQATFRLDLSALGALCILLLAGACVLAQIGPVTKRSPILGVGGLLVATTAEYCGIHVLWGGGVATTLESNLARMAAPIAGGFLALGIGAAMVALDLSQAELRHSTWAPIGAAVFVATVGVALLLTSSPLSPAIVPSNLAWFPLLGGSAAVGVMVHLALKAHLRGALLQIANRKLEEEILERRKSEQAAHAAKEQLEARVENRTEALESANQALREEFVEREHVQDDLWRQKEILQSIFDHIPVMINFVDRNHQLRLVNREWERTLGWSLEEIQSQNIDILEEGYPDPQYREQVRHFVTNSHAEWADFKTTVRDGRVIDTSWAMLHLSDGTGIGIGQDITKRKRAEEALRESEERFRQLAENIQDLFWIKSPDFKRVLYMSPMYKGMSGRSPEDRYQDESYQPFLDRIIPEDRARVEEIMQRASGEEFDVEFRITNPDGSIHWIRDRGFPIRDESGRVYRMAGTAQDITERKLAEEALRESEERFRQLAENIREVFWLRSLDLTQLLYVSPLYEKVCGKASEVIYATGLDLDIVHPEDRTRVAGLMQRFGGQEFEIEYRIITKGGEVRWLRDRGFPIRNQAGQIYRMGGVAEDITERKEAEDRQRASSEQLRALSASLQIAREKEATRIARQIHDDMGGILTGLRWEIEELEKMIQQPADPAGLKAMQAKLATMAGLTDTTVNVVRRIASELRPSILDDLGLMEAIEWQAEQFQTRTGIECRCDCALQGIPLGDLESTAVFRVVQEALTNIIRHAQATQVRIRMRIEDEMFILAVVDNGRGITQEEVLNRKSLGLLGMQERTHLIGGQVEIVGDKGTGTTLRVRVPLSKTMAEGAGA